MVHEFGTKLSCFCCLLEQQTMIALWQASGILSKLAHQKNDSNEGIFQAGFNRASIIKLCATTEDQTNDLKWARPFQVQRANP